MNRQKVASLLKKVKIEIKHAGRIAHISRLDGLEAGKTAAFSPSSSGDREHAQNQAILNENKVAIFKTLERDLEGELKKELPFVIRPVCYFEVRYLDMGKERRENYYVVNTHVNIGRELRLITPESPLGMEVVGKKVGEKFQYETDRKISGEIVFIE